MFRAKHFPMLKIVVELIAESIFIAESFEKCFARNNFIVKKLLYYMCQYLLTILLLDNKIIL
jgi:hypothetical protein